MMDYGFSALWAILFGLGGLGLGSIPASGAPIHTPQVSLRAEQLVGAWRCQVVSDDPSQSASYDIDYGAIGRGGTGADKGVYRFNTLARAPDYLLRVQGKGEWQLIDGRVIKRQDIETTGVMVEAGERMTWANEPAQTEAVEMLITSFGDGVMTKQDYDDPNGMHAQCQRLGGSVAISPMTGDKVRK